MTTENKTNTPVEVPKQADRNAILATKVAESLRNILGNNFGSRIALGASREQTEKITILNAEESESADR